MEYFEQKTWIGSEEEAYNTRTGSHSKSNRRAFALCEDGRFRIVTCGIADTYYTIPAHVQVGSKYWRGFVSLSEDNVVLFTRYTLSASVPLTPKRRPA